MGTVAPGSAAKAPIAFLESLDKNQPSVSRQTHPSHASDDHAELSDRGANMLDWEGIEVDGGRYRVLRKLAQGGHAEVYLAHDEKLEQSLVLKVPRLSWLEEPGFSERNRREIRTMVKLKHARTVRVLDHGEHRGRPFTVLEYLSGGTLADRQRQQRDEEPGSVPVETIPKWLPQIADGPMKKLDGDGTRADSAG